MLKSVTNCRHLAWGLRTLSRTILRRKLAQLGGSKFANQTKSKQTEMHDLICVLLKLILWELLCEAMQSRFFHIMKDVQDRIVFALYAQMPFVKQTDLKYQASGIQHGQHLRRLGCSSCGVLLLCDCMAGGNGSFPVHIGSSSEWVCIQNSYLI